MNIKVFATAIWLDTPYQILTLFFHVRKKHLKLLSKINSVSDIVNTKFSVSNRWGQKVVIWPQNRQFVNKVTKNCTKQVTENNSRTGYSNKTMLSTGLNVMKSQWIGWNEMTNEIPSDMDKMRWQLTNAWMQWQMSGNVLSKSWRLETRGSGEMVTDRIWQMIEWHDRYDDNALSQKTNEWLSDKWLYKVRRLDEKTHNRMKRHETTDEWNDTRAGWHDMSKMHNKWYPIDEEGRGQA